MHKELLSKIYDIVEEVYVKETNIFGYGVWTYHITKVAKNAKFLAPLFNPGPEILEITALLHNNVSVKDGTLYKGHHIHLHSFF